MKRIRHWLEDTGFTFGHEHLALNILAGLAIVGMVVTVFISNIPQPVPAAGEQQPDPLPWVFDLCIAYLSAFLFHLLVVAQPARRKEKSRILTLAMPLEAIAYSGMDMVRDLERIASCPPLRVTEEHLIKVLRAINHNGDITAHIAFRLSVAASAYKEIVPYAADLPLDLQAALQRKNRASLTLWFPPDKVRVDVNTSLQDLRRVVPQDLWNGGKLVYQRVTLAGHARVFMEYYKASEAVRVALAKYQPQVPTPSEDDGTTPGRFAFFYGNEHERYWTYPIEAHSELLHREEEKTKFPPFT